MRACKSGGQKECPRTSAAADNPCTAIALWKMLLPTSYFSAMLVLLHTFTSFWNLSTTLLDAALHAASASLVALEPCSRSFKSFSCASRVDRAKRCAGLSLSLSTTRWVDLISVRTRMRKELCTSLRQASRPPYHVMPFYSGLVKALQYCNTCVPLFVRAEPSNKGAGIPRLFRRKLILGDRVLLLPSLDAAAVDPLYRDCNSRIPSAGP